MEQKKNPDNWPYWQDMEMTVPAEKDGDPVAVVLQDPKFGVGALTQPLRAHQPVMAGGVPVLDGSEEDPDCMRSLPENLSGTRSK